MNTFLRKLGVQVQSVKTIEQIVGQNIRERRLLKGWTQSDLATAAKIHTQTVSVLETGKRGAQRSILVAIANALGCTVEDLNGLKGQPTPTAETLLEIIKERDNRILELENKLSEYREIIISSMKPSGPEFQEKMAKLWQQQEGKVHRSKEPRKSTRRG